ncbi:CMP-sialic acid transporter 4 [Platanthera guangdongensis]|uniref:CMP-sialic acid transporter 4 n=1 Tax=Platanthera guangdongensis TaxID=2320717 RepID=A0ABR2MVF6_9ASPA
MTNKFNFRKYFVIAALTVLTSSQAIFIVWSKRAGKYEYSVTTANFLVEALKCVLSLVALFKIWRRDGITQDNKLSSSFDEVILYPIPAMLYLIKNLLQYYIFAYVDAPAYQILKNLNIISTGVLYRLFLKKNLSAIQWAAFILLCAGCTTAQLDTSSDRALQTPLQGWIMAIVMALLSGFAGVYTEAIIKKRPSRNINVQNFWLYIFGMIFNLGAIFIQDFDDVFSNGFFHGYSFIIVCMILNHALRSIQLQLRCFLRPFYQSFSLVSTYLFPSSWVSRLCRSLCIFTKPGVHQNKPFDLHLQALEDGLIRLACMKFT